LTVKDAEELNTELSGSFDGIGAEVSKKNGKIIIVAPLKNTPADRAGLMPQDEIVAVDGVSTYNLSVTDVVTKIRGKKNTKVELTIMRNTWDKPKIISIVRSSINIPSAEVTMLPNNIALLRIYNFYQPLPSQIAKAVQTIQTNKAKGIILDLRNNPGGFLDIYTDIGNYFFADNTLLLIEDYEDKQFNKEYKTFRDGELKDIPIVVLINEGTASAAEILAGALRDNRGVKLVGENSFGKGSVQELVDLSGGNQLKITVAHWLTPNGTDISKKGIKPDIVVKLEQEEDNGSYSAITLENDSQLKRAYDEIISSAK
jgi:carboxyl-terminal processing protease